tara:strand:- start:225 stop:422 length:198 start_codon:yes stop_codon:yes gene_type:complete
MKDKKKPKEDDIKIQKRKEYMKKYYRRKKAERIKNGTCISICRGKIPTKNKYFTIKRGTFIVSFS